MRVIHHPILGENNENKKINFYIDDKVFEAMDGDTIASALLANNIRICRYTPKNHEPRGVFCCIGRCNDCLVTVDGIPNVRACITPIQEGMKIKIQHGKGTWEGLHEKY